MNEEKEESERELIFKKLDERIDKLQNDWKYSTKPLRIPGDFSKEAHIYYKSIATRLDELQWIIKNI